MLSMPTNISGVWPISSLDDDLKDTMNSSPFDVLVQATCRKKVVMCYAKLGEVSSGKVKMSMPRVSLASSRGKMSLFPEDGDVSTVFCLLML